MVRLVANRSVDQSIVVYHDRFGILLLLLYIYVIPGMVGPAHARLDPVDRPDLLPKEFTTIIDIAGTGDGECESVFESNRIELIRHVRFLRFPISESHLGFFIVVFLPSLPFPQVFSLPARRSAWPKSSRESSATADSKCGFLRKTTRLLQGWRSK